MNRKNYMRAWRAKNHKKVLAYNRAWYKAHPERFLEWRRQYHKKHREKVNAYFRRRHKNNPDLAYFAGIKYRYGATKEFYLTKKKEQKNKCAVCGKKSTGKKRLAVDHHHKNKQLRGLLCTNCNILIGACKEKIVNLRAAIRYLIYYNKVKEQQNVLL